MRTITLHPNHPYLKCFDVGIVDLRGLYRVKWRDFLSVKQDADFATREAAERFAKEVKERAAIVSLGALDDIDETVAGMTAYWQELANSSE